MNNFEAVCETHTDKDFAKKSGLPDVIAHGMLIMSYLGRLLTNSVPQYRIKNFNVQFSNMTYVNQKIICTGKVLEKNSIDGEEIVTIAVCHNTNNLKFANLSFLKSRIDIVLKSISQGEYD